ncbi:putative holin-like toxin [Paenibacillus macerans]|nr:putative holin-like toxin [Paenibacillus macerans]
MFGMFIVALLTYLKKK